MNSAENDAQPDYGLGLRVKAVRVLELPDPCDLYDAALAATGDPIKALTVVNVEMLAATGRDRTGAEESAARLVEPLREWPGDLDDLCRGIALGINQGMLLIGA